MSVPLHWSDAGLPIGVKFIGRVSAPRRTLIRLAGTARGGAPVGPATAAGAVTVPADALRALTSAAARVPAAEAERIAAEHYGIVASARRLPGEKDDNFALAAGADAWLLKVVHPEEPARGHEPRHRGDARAGGRRPTCPSRVSSPRARGRPSWSSVRPTAPSGARG